MGEKSTEKCTIASFNSIEESLISSYLQSVLYIFKCKLLLIYNFLKLVFDRMIIKNEFELNNIQLKQTSPLKTV